MTKLVACFAVHVAVQLDTDIPQGEPAAMIQAGIAAAMEAKGVTARMEAAVAAMPAVIYCAVEPQAVVDRHDFDRAKAEADAANQALEQAGPGATVMPPAGGVH